jgi:hypothetical protein
MSLPRSCLGCGALVRGASRCPACKANRERAKRARRPDLHNDHAERRRRREVVADHRAIGATGARDGNANPLTCRPT